MSRILNYRLVLVPFLLLSLQLASAQVSSGPYTFRFDTSTFPVWDLTGPYVMDQDILGPKNITTPLVYTLPTLIHDNSGRLHGNGLMMVTVGEDVVAATYSASGSVSGGGANTRAVFTVRFSGEGAIAGLWRRFSASISYNLAVNPTQLVLAGSARGSISISGMGSGKISSHVAPSLPPGVDGAWQVQMNLLALSKIGGTAVVAVDSFSAPDGSSGPATGRLMPAKISGSFNSRTDVARVQLSGINEGRGISLLVIFDANTLDAQLSGKILGQTIRY